MGILKFIWMTGVIWLPAVLFFAGKKYWLKYKNREFLLSDKKVLMRIRFYSGRKRPVEAMEYIFDGLYSKGGYGDLKKLWLSGWLPNGFSLEIVSFGGNVNFFVRVGAGDVEKLILNFKSYYPNVLVERVDDYMDEVSGYVGGDMDIFFAELTKGKDEYLPIKTYVNSGLDSAGLDDAYKMDPLVNVLTYLSSMREGEVGGVQIFLRAGTRRFVLNGKRVSWDKYVESKYNELKSKYSYEESGHKFLKKNEMAPEDEVLIEDVGRNAFKKGFDAGIRLFYIAGKKNFSSGKGGVLLSMFAGYNWHNFFKKFNDASADGDWFGIKSRAKKRNAWGEIKMRSYFNYPADRDKVFNLTTEEVASLFHFPPTLGEIEEDARAGANFARYPGISHMGSNVPLNNIPSVADDGSYFGA